jgi:PBP1b-binding outer membrane lipoprotein LpoB
MKSTIIIAALLLAGCASGPIIDPKASKTPENFYLDQMECERISQNVSYGNEMLKSAAIQGILSGIMGAAIGSGPNAAGVGAASGAVVGAGKGAWDTNNRRAKIVTKCLQGRGYSVLE